MAPPPTVHGSALPHTGRPAAGWAARADTAEWPCPPSTWPHLATPGHRAWPPLLATTPGHHSWPPHTWPPHLGHHTWQLEWLGGPLRTGPPPCGAKLCPACPALSLTHGHHTWPRLATPGHHTWPPHLATTHGRHTWPSHTWPPHLGCYTWQLAWLGGPLRTGPPPYDARLCPACPALRLKHGHRTWPHLTTPGHHTWPPHLATTPGHHTRPSHTWPPHLGRYTWPLMRLGAR